MKKIILLFAFTFSTAIFSQQQSDFWKHVRFGGGFGMNFGSSFNMLIAPSAVYDFENGFSLGAGLNYQHSENGSVNTNVYGISAISLYDVPVVGIQLSGEFEQLFANQKNAGITVYRNNYPALYFGLGYSQGRASFGIRYDVLYDKTKSVFASPFSPIFRFYF